MGAQGLRDPLGFAGKINTDLDIRLDLYCTSFLVSFERHHIVYICAISYGRLFAQRRTVPRRTFEIASSDQGDVLRDKSYQPERFKCSDVCVRGISSGKTAHVPQLGLYRSTDRRKGVFREGVMRIREPVSKSGMQRSIRSRAVSRPLVNVHPASRKEDIASNAFANIAHWHRALTTSGHGSQKGMFKGI